MSGLIEDNQIFVIASTFKLIQYVVLVEVSEENQASHRHVIRQKKEYINSLLS